MTMVMTMTITTMTMMTVMIIWLGFTATLAILRFFFFEKVIEMIMNVEMAMTIKITTMATVAMTTMTTMTMMTVMISGLDSPQLSTLILVFFSFEKVSVRMIMIMIMRMITRIMRMIMMRIMKMIIMAYQQIATTQNPTMDLCIIHVLR